MIQGAWRPTGGRGVGRLAFQPWTVYVWVVMKQWITLFLALMGTLSVHAKIITQIVEYTQGDATLEG